jgi:hypothetical protein
MTKRTLAHAIKTRDANGIPHIAPVSRAYAKQLIKGSCITRKHRGMGGEFHLVLANGLVVLVDMLTPKQLRANGL